ncbi:hypothetical protein JB92DRAFT_3129640 [Gautieria morchelliformis]|nr:hypothetical protein JB92DRAFT_3129640 [Gautieria morchelliformis]
MTRGGRQRAGTAHSLHPLHLLDTFPASADTFRSISCGKGPFDAVIVPARIWMQGMLTLLASRATGMSSSIEQRQHHTGSPDEMRQSLTSQTTEKLAGSEGAGGVWLSASPGQYAEHSHSPGEAVGVTVLPGGGVEAVRESSVTVEGVRSTEARQSSTSRTAARSAELDVTTSTNGIAGASGFAHVRLADSEGGGSVSLSASSGRHAGHSQSRGEAVGVTVLPGSGVGAAREFVTVEGVRSTEEIMQSSTSQTTERSAELETVRRTLQPSPR